MQSATRCLAASILFLTRAKQMKYKYRAKLGVIGFDPNAFNIFSSESSRHRRQVASPSHGASALVLELGCRQFVGK